MIPQGDGRQGIKALFAERLLGDFASGCGVPFRVGLLVVTGGFFWRVATTRSSGRL